MKSYVEFDPNVILPRSSKFYYECQECGDLLPSKPNDNVNCTCFNIRIDVDAGKMAIRDNSQIKLVRMQYVKKEWVGALLIMLGVVFMALACTNANRAPNLGFLMGTYLPGLFLLGLGVKLLQEKKVPDDGGMENPYFTIQHQRRANAEMGIVGGIVLMFMGSGLSQQSYEYFLFGLAVLLGGWGLMIFGASNFSKWKGYSGWYGLIGLLLLPGLIILFCLPNREKDNRRSNNANDTCTPNADSGMRDAAWKPPKGEQRS